MKRYFLIFIICGLVSQFTRGQQQNPILDWESLPIIRSGVKIKAYSSTNPTGRTMRDFRNFTMQDTDGFEMINIMSPGGMLVQLWFTALPWGNNTFGPGRFGKINLYLSGAETPDFIKDRDLYFNRPELSMPRPLWDMEGPAQWAFPCLPFQNRLRMTSSENPQWFQVTAHLYRDSSDSEKIPLSDLYEVNNRLIDYRERYPGRERGNRQFDAARTLEPGSTAEIFNRAGEAVIRSVVMEISNPDNRVLDNIWVVVNYGDDEKNAIEVPVTVFFGGYVEAPVTNSKGLPCGFLNNEFYFYFPMPFRDGCSINLVNRSAEEFSFSSRIRWNDSNDYDPSKSGKFYIQYNDNVQVAAGEPDFVHLGKEGSGMLVGTTANLAGSIEGNFRMYIDDSNTPAIETTGGEDYFCQAFGIDVGLCTPFHGGLYEKIGYRFHIIDYVPFLRSIRFTQDHGHEQMHDRDGIFRSAVFYYWNAAQQLYLDDSLDVGNRQEEKRHNLKVTGRQSTERSDEGRYEGNYDTVFTDEGKWFDGTIAIDVKIHPGNQGLRIRRRINQQQYHQEMEVYVDGESAGLWFEQGANYQLLKEPDPENHPGYTPDWEKIKAIFRDTEFEIPAEMTNGKEKIRLEFRAKNGLSAVNPENNGECNAYYFWIYSYVSD